MLARINADGDDYPAMIINLAHVAYFTVPVVRNRPRRDNYVETADVTFSDGSTAELTPAQAVQLAEAATRYMDSARDGE